MPVSAQQKAAIEEVLNALLNITQGGRYKRHLTDMFLELPDKGAYPEYYQVIPEPRCVNEVQKKLEDDEYSDCLTVFEDISLVFLNALYYNEAGSQIWTDAEKLRSISLTEWKARQVLPLPPDALSSKSPQKVHKQPTPPPSAPPPAQAPVSTSVPPAMATRSSAQVASSSVTEAPLALRPLSIRPRASSREQSPDVDVDIERGTPEPEGYPEEEARDEETQAIILQLERGLPRWQGLEDYGWNQDILATRFLDVIVGLKGYKDAIGIRVAIALEAMPEETHIAELPYSQPLSLKSIETRVRSKSFPSSESFDKEVSLLFLKGRRHYEPGSEAYGRVVLLQRLYQALTSSSPPAGPPYISSSNFSSTRAGPGTARPMYATPGIDTEGVPGVTTFRVSSKDRTFVDELQYKGCSIRLGDWLHMSNADDPSRPVVGQVFRCFVSEEASTKGKPGISLCWYYRPEQTIHPATRLFWENEVFKTSHFADHTLEDVIEKIACQFTARHIRGRPRPPFWYRGWPLYVCDSRYNDRERCFVKIKNWNSCVPEDVRKNQEWMPIYPFERMIYPRRFGSPFLKKGGPRGPGGIGDSVERAEGEKIEGGGTGRKRARKGGSGTSTATDLYGPSRGHYAGPIAAVSTTNSLQQPFPIQYAPGQPPRTGTAQSGQEDRSILHAAGGLVALNGNAQTERLPAETTKHFDRDGQTNEVLWFSAPPNNVARPRPPEYSLAYLHHLAMKRKQAAGAHGTAESSKRARGEVQPTATELVNRLLAEHSIT